MAKVKKLHLSGHSILEVIVSTIIIVLAFMLFSSLIGQLTGSINSVDETKILLTLDKPLNAGVVDTTWIQKVNTNLRILQINEAEKSVPFNHIKIYDKGTNRVIFQYYLMLPAQTSLFQQ